MTKTPLLSRLCAVVISAMVATGAISGCEDDDQGTIGTAADCDDVCARYRTCFDASFDVPACTGQCQMRLGNATIQSSDIGDCMDCLGDNACTPFSSCADACDTIIIVP